MDDDKLVEEAISEDSSKFDGNSVCTEAEDFSDDNQVIYEIPQSMLSCFQLERDRLNSIERLLKEDPEEKRSAKDEKSRGPTPDNCEDFLRELASEYGEDLATLKKRIISEIEDEESHSDVSTEDAQTASNEKAAELIPPNDEDCDEYIETERQFRTEMVNLERRLKAEEEKRMAEHKVMKERLMKARKEEEDRRMRRHQFFEEELKRIEYDNLVQQHLELDSKNSNVKGRISRELSKQQELITGLQKHMVEERLAFEQVQAEQRTKTQEKQCRAATRIQASVRAFLVRTKNAMALNERREARRQKKEAQLRLDKERKEKEEQILRKLAELKIRREEEQRRKEEERVRLKEEEEKRKEQERIRQEEEKKREEQERIRLMEEKKREEEERIRQEEEKKREEQERIRQEEERRKKEEEEQRERERVREAEERERRQKQEEEEARKRKEEEVRKQEELERQQRVEEEERQRRETEEREAEELRKQEEEERTRQLQQETRTTEDNREEEEATPGGKENLLCLSAESERETAIASDSISSSEEPKRGMGRPASNDTVSEADQSEEEQYSWRLKCFYGTSQSSVGSSTDEAHPTVRSGEAGEAGLQRQGGRPFLPSDEAVDDCGRPLSSTASLSDSAEPNGAEWVKDLASWAKPAPQNKKRPVLKTAIVRRGQPRSLPPPASDSVVQSASGSSYSEGLMAGQLEQPEEDSGQVVHTKARTSHPALMVRKSTAKQGEEEKKKELQLPMEKEERARMMALEQRRRKEEEERKRRAAEEEEQIRLESERRRKEEEEPQRRETEEGDARKLEEQEEGERAREERQGEEEELVPEGQPAPRCSDVNDEEEAAPAPDSSSGDPARGPGSRAGVPGAVGEPVEVEGRRHPSSLMCLPDGTEQKRLQWMKECVPWTKLSLQNKRRQVASAKAVRRASVKILPPLRPDAILQSAAWSSLKQVTTVTLEDLPGCSLSTLSECTELQALTLRRCGLLALEGLSGCRSLRYIDLQENEIKFVNCKDLTQLRVLLLSQNQLTSIQGLEDAVNLDILELSHNRISRLSGLGSQKRLQRLLIDHNQLISTRGLSELYTLLYLDCGYNHLTSMGDIENCALLSTLKLQGNNLTEPPSLKNHVLMKEVYLDDNVVSSLDSLSACWLPLLQLISASKNSITHLPPLSDCVSLQKLDISHNCLSELANVCGSLKECSQLQEIDFSGNPFQQESNWRPSLLQTVPGLRRINGEWISSPAPPSGRAGSPLPGSFLGFCRAQLQQLERVQRRHQAQLSAPCPSDVPTIISQHCEELLLLAEEHRYAHEFGELTVVDKAEPASSGRSLDKAMLPASPVVESSQDTAGRLASLIQKTEGNAATSSSVPEPSACTSVVDARGSVADLTGDRYIDPLQNRSNDKPSKNPCRKFDLKNMAAIVIQSFWRGHRCRRASRLNAVRRVAGGDGVAVGRDPWQPSPDQWRAATVIQAVWKGYVLRKRLASALAAARVTETDEEFVEVDMDEFSFDEAALDRDWITLDSEPSPPRALPPCEQLLLRPKPPAHPSTLRTSPSALPWQPRQAWPGGESERAAHSERRSISPDITELMQRTKSPLACMFGPPKEKSEKIMKEWGLRDKYTAQLMLKRAQKMKPKKKKDRRSSDPAAYLDLFRSGENKQAHVQMPKRKQPEKSQALKANEEEVDEQKKISREWTDLWLQSQASILDPDRISPPMDSERFLPEIDVDILNGRRVQLVSVSALPRGCPAGPGQRDGPDQESESRASAAALSPPRKEHNQTRANAVGHAKKEAPAPVQATSGPSKKERISFRDNPVQLSLGWGGGKKRSQLRK